MLRRACVMTWRMGWSLLWLCYSTRNLLQIKTCNFVMIKMKSLGPSLAVFLHCVLLLWPNPRFHKWGPACVKPPVCCVLGLSTRYLLLREVASAAEVVT